MPATVLKRLSLLDRFLPVWIFLSMMMGVFLGHAAPGIGAILDKVKIANVSLPIAIGLLWMMYPVLAKVKYESLGTLAGQGRLIGTSVVFNWVIGPVAMFALAWFLLPDFPQYRNGLILVGLARCIAMVLIWNLLARGSNEVAAVLVALNSLFQILMYSVMGYFFLSVLPRWLGEGGTALNISMAEIAKNVLVFLGVPLLAGFLTRKILVKRRGLLWYEGRFLAYLSPMALVGLLYTIVLMFSMQGEKILQLPVDVLRIAVPLLVYFLLMWTAAFLTGKSLGFSYPETAALAFTAAGNNFELAIAVAVGMFGIASPEALAAVVGPLIEVPALVGLVYVSLWAKRHFYKNQERSDSSLTLSGQANRG